MNPPQANGSGPEQGDGALIYVVDDEPMLLELALVILEPLGYRVQIFRDPELALQAFTTTRPRPALVITDYAMHSMSGMALIEACWKIEPAQRTLLISGTVGPEVFRHAPRKPDRFLAKPYQARQLAELVHSLLPN